MYQKSNLFKINMSKAAHDPVLDTERCAYSEYGKRCPLPGSVSTSVREGGVWYCSGHSLYNYGKEAHDILIYNEKNYHSIIHLRCCRKLLCEKCSSIKKAKNDCRQN